MLTFLRVLLRFPRRSRLVYCECGCGKLVPQRDTVRRKTGIAHHPVERLYRPHAKEIYPDEY
jgi:hypothetical protein